MLEIIDRVIDWQAAIQAARDGTLQDYLNEAEESGDLDTVSLIEFTNDDRFATFNAIGEAYSTLRKSVPSEQSELTDLWFHRIFGTVAGADSTVADSPELFKDDAFLTSFNPETIDELVEVGEQIDFEQLSDAFQEAGSPEQLEEWADVLESPDGPDNFFATSFLPYVRGWHEFFQRVASEGKGAIFHAG